MMMMMMMMLFFGWRQLLKEDKYEISMWIQQKKQSRRIRWVLCNLGQWKMQPMFTMPTSSMEWYQVTQKRQIQTSKDVGRSVGVRWLPASSSVADPLLWKKKQKTTDACPDAAKNSAGDVCKAHGQATNIHDTCVQFVVGVMANNHNL